MDSNDIESLFAEIDAAIEAYSRSIDSGLALAAEMRQLADEIEGGFSESFAEVLPYLAN